MLNEKKRKGAPIQESRPSKKQQTGGTLQVHHLPGTATSQPVFASSPGIKIANDLKFHAFEKTSPNGSSELLLHSSSHPTIDYVATEGSGPRDMHMRHYIAVSDPQKHSLLVSKAKYLTIRRSIRQSEPAPDSEDEDREEHAAVTNYSSRAALTEAFGTKKSRKAVQSMVENRQLAQGSEGSTRTNAVLDTVSDNEEPDQAALSRNNKPLPKPNLATVEIELVYPLSELVYPKPVLNTLESLHPGSWLARLNVKKDIKWLRSRFVANRIDYLGKSLLASPNAADPKLLQAIRLLRYIELLVELNSYLSRLHPKRKIPDVDKWPPKTLLDGTPHAIIRPLLSHFLPQSQPTVHGMTLLRTTILAAALHIPPPSLQAGNGKLITEPTDLALDLAMESSEIKRLYRELGCKVETAKDKELQLWGLEKINKNKPGGHNVTVTAPVFAKLKIPLEFPKVSRGRPLQRR